MRAVRERIPVVVQGGRRPGRRRWAARGLWAAAETAVTAGLVLMLLVVHQLWWTNREALAGARAEVRSLERQWASSAGTGDGTGEGDGGVAGGASGDPGAPVPGPTDRTAPTDPGPPVTVPGEAAGTSTGTGRGGAAGGGAGGAGRPRPAAPNWDQAYAILRIPRLGVVAPVAEGTSKRGVLDKGYVGHYAGTARPGAPGNFALAGHRNTHGEPFRHINRLRAGDLLVVDVRGHRYTYRVGRRLDQTLARDTGVIAPVPRSVVRPAYGYSEPGSYITLTTCTPEFTSRYRLVVWGTLVSTERR
ncbi:class E sortase [Streptomyces sp. NPDC097619]|uniref:class E sortase n=1 Tax=Streptomyces sp. NPDC097619 TaxID=3157228 RepID=UPI003328A45E